MGSLLVAQLGNPAAAHTYQSIADLSLNLDLGRCRLVELKLRILRMGPDFRLFLTYVPRHLLLRTYPTRR